MSTDLTTPEQRAAELAKQDEELAAAGLANIDKTKLALPIIQLTQQLSNAVTDNKVESGHWYNNITGEDYGTDIEVVLAWYYMGRFYAPEDSDQSYVASGAVAPSSWPEEFAGKHFADIPQAEEQHRAQANAEGGSWGSGPEIETTHNFIGFVVGDPDTPVRISLKSTSNPAATKIQTLASFARSFYVNTFRLSITERRNKANKPYFVAQAEKGVQTTEEQRNVAREIASAMQQQQFSLVGDEPEPERPAKPGKPKAAAEVV